MGYTAAAAAKSLQLCPTLCDPIDGSPAASPIPRILQARTLEWVAISFSNAWKWKVKVKSLSHVWLFVTPGTAAYQAPLPIGFSRQEYWSGFSWRTSIPSCRTPFSWSNLCLKHSVHNTGLKHAIMIQWVEAVVLLKFVSLSRYYMALQLYKL